MTPELTIIQAWPAAMRVKDAAAYLSESESNFRKLFEVVLG